MAYCYCCFCYCCCCCLRELILSENWMAGSPSLKMSLMGSAKLRDDHGSLGIIPEQVLSNFGGRQTCKQNTRNHARLSRHSPLTSRVKIRDCLSHFLIWLTKWNQPTLLICLCITRNQRTNGGIGDHGHRCQRSCSPHHPGISNKLQNNEKIWFSGVFSKKSFPSVSTRQHRKFTFPHKIVCHDHINCILLHHLQ